MNFPRHFTAFEAIPKLDQQSPLNVMTTDILAILRNLPKYTKKDETSHMLHSKIQSITTEIENYIRSRFIAIDVDLCVALYKNIGDGIINFFNKNVKSYGPAYENIFIDVISRSINSGSLPIHVNMTRVDMRLAAPHLYMSFLFGMLPLLKTSREVPQEETVATLVTLARNLASGDAETHDLQSDLLGQLLKQAYYQQHRQQTTNSQKGNGYKRAETVTQIMLWNIDRNYNIHRNNAADDDDGPHSDAPDEVYSNSASENDDRDELS
jgi:hypothetical protein